MNELEQAKRICQKAGYFVIPREKTLVLETVNSIPNADLMRYSKDDYMSHELQRAYQRLAAELAAKGVCEVAEASAGEPAHTKIRLTLRVIPHNYAIDPYVQMIRDEQDKLHE